VLLAVSYRVVARLRLRPQPRPWNSRTSNF
jgi:hypothetical protein